VIAGYRVRERERVAHVDVHHVATLRADEVVVLVERGFVLRRAAGMGEDLDQADTAQDVERAVDRAEADAGQFEPHAFEDGLGAEVLAVLQRAQNPGALLRQAVARLQESCIDALGVVHDALPS